MGRRRALSTGGKGVGVGAVFVIGGTATGAGATGISSIFSVSLTWQLAPLKIKNIAKAVKSFVYFIIL